MFGFNKKKKIFERKHKGLDSILLGVILGSAIGSVLGIGLAPKKGSDTRKFLSNTASKIYNGAKGVVVGGAQKVSDAVSDAADVVTDAVSDAVDDVTDKAHKYIDNKEKEKKREVAKMLSARDKIKEIPEED